MEENAAVMELNLEGLMCPMPVVKLAQAVGEIDLGAIVAATATDPGVLADIPAWCASTGNELLDMNRDNGVFRFQVRRAS